MLLSACTTKKAVDVNHFFITEGVELTCGMDELSESKEYVELISPSESIRQVINEMSSQDYSMPENVYIMNFSYELLMKVAPNFQRYTEIPPNILEKLNSKLNALMLANMINGAHSVEVVAGMSIINWGKSYVQPDGWLEDTILILDYPGEFSSIVSFVETGEGVISGQASFVKKGDTDIITLLNEYLGLKDDQYEHYSKDQLKEILVQ